MRFLFRKGVLVNPGMIGVEACKLRLSGPRCGVVLAHSPGGETGTINNRLQLPWSIITYFQFMGLAGQLMGLSAPSTGKACGASPLRASLLGTASGSTPQLNRYSTAIHGAQRPLRQQSHDPLRHPPHAGRARAAAGFGAAFQAASPHWGLCEVPRTRAEMS